MPQDPIASRIDAFVIELEALVRSAAVAAVEQALATTGSRAAAPRKRGRPPGKRPAPAKAAARPAAKKAAAPKKAAAAKATGPVAERALAYVKANPGNRLEQIAKALRVASPSLKDLVADLVATKKLRKTGKTRGTRYFPG